MSLEAIADAIKLLTTIGGILVISYSGVMLIICKDSIARSQWKEVIQIVVVGLCVIYLAPIISSIFSGGSYCG